MKRLISLTALSFFLLLQNSAHAQSKTGVDYFAGKWSVLVTGTPYGDLRRIYVLDKNDNTLTGTVQDSTGSEIAKCSKVEVKDEEATLYYQAMGIDVYITLARKDEDHVTGTVLGTFEAHGERVK